MPFFEDDDNTNIISVPIYSNILSNKKNRSVASIISLPDITTTIRALFLFCQIFKMLHSYSHSVVCFILMTILLQPGNNGGRPFSNCQALSSISMPPMTTTGEHLPLARKAMDYFDDSSDPFHAVQTSIDLLKEAGFKELDETGGAMDVCPGGKYYYTRNKSSLVAFAIGEKFKPGSGGFKIIGGHTDSPNLRVKPRSKRSAKTAKSIQIGAECYGGGLWHTWFDRDLGLSGRVFCRNKDGDTEFINQRLVKVSKVARISFT